MQLITAIIRVVQFLFAVVVLALSVTLAKNQAIGPVPAVTGYAAFTGGLGIIAAMVGAVSFFVSSLEGLISWALDGVASLAFLAGGVAFAVLLRGTNCGDESTTARNELLNGGCTRIKGDTWCAYGPDDLKPRCTSAKADSAFMILGCVVCVAVVVCSFLSSRGKSRGTTWA